MVSSCKYGHGLCDQPLAFWRSRCHSDAWQQIDVDLPRNTAASVNARGKTVCVVGDTLFTGGGQDKLYVSTDGRHFAARPSPCDHTQDLALYQVVATSARDVDELCIGDPGMSRAIKTVYRSTETGKTTQYAGQAGPYGIQSQLAASASGNLAMSSVASGSFIYLNGGGGSDWSMPVDIGDGGKGWNDIVYTRTRSRRVHVRRASAITGSCDTSRRRASADPSYGHPASRLSTTRTMGASKALRRS